MTSSRELLCELLRTPAAASGCVTAALVNAAREERVHLLLAERLRNRGSVDPALRDLEDDLRAAAALESARLVEVRAVLAALAAAGVRTIVIKGGALAYTHYPRPELRPRLDTDLMVPPERRDDVARVLARLGYERPAEVDGELITGQFHFQKHDRAGVAHALDVHWRVSNVRAFAGALSYDELARDAVPLPPLGADAWGACSVHSLLLACIHRVAHHGDSDELLWLCDVHLLAHGFSPREREALAALASERQMRAVCGKGLQLASAAFGGIDPDWIAALAGSIDGAEPAAAFLGGGLRPVDILRADLAAVPRWQGRIQLLREHLFPSPAFMYERYDTRRALALPFLYLHRMVSGLPKWFRR